jgi:hypothetical protein
MELINLLKNENTTYVLIALLSNHFGKLIFAFVIYYFNERLKQWIKVQKEIKLKELEQQKGCNLAESKTQKLIVLLNEAKQENKEIKEQNSEINNKLNEIIKSSKIEKTIYVEYIKEAAEEIKKQGRDIDSMKGTNKNIETHLKTVDTIFTQLIERVGNNGK